MAGFEYVPASATIVGIREAAATDDVFSSGVDADTNDRFVVNADGSMEWGPGNAALDTMLSRGAADRLVLTDGAVANSGFVFGSTGNIVFGRVPNGNPGISSGGDVTFYRSGAGTWTMDGHLTLNDAKNVAVGSVTGTKIGTATTQKIGFFNATPVTQPASPGADATDLASVITLANNIKARLVSLGLTA